MNSVYCRQRERQTDREEERGQESGGAIFVQALSWKLQPHYKWRHPENTWIVKQMACVRPSMMLRRGCATVCTTHTGTHVSSRMTVVSSSSHRMNINGRAWFFFFREQRGGGREILRVKGCVTGNGVHSVSESSPFSLSFN